MSPPPKKLQVALAQTDVILTRLSKLVSTPSGIDISLHTIAYTLTFLHARLSSIFTRRLESFALELTKNAQDTLLPGETLIATVPAPPHTARIARLMDSSRSLASLISDFRIFFRLWGLLGIYSWGKSTYLAGPKDSMIKVLIWTQVISNVFYQILENGAYLSSKGVLKWDKAKETQWWLWSSRFWAAHVALDFGRLGRTWWLQQQEKIATAGDDGEKQLKVRNTENEIWWREAVVNAAYAPLTLHWSLEQGVVSEAWVGFLGMVTGIIGLKEQWKTTATS